MRPGACASFHEVNLQIPWVLAIACAACGGLATTVRDEAYGWYEIDEEGRIQPARRCGKHIPQR